MIYIEKVEESDFEKLMSWIESEQELRQWAAHSLNYPIDINELSISLNAPDTFKFKAVHLGEMVGYADFSRVNKKNGTATICRVLVPKKLRGQGVAFEMLKRMCSFAFTELGLRRIDLLVFDFNVYAIKVYKKLGFQQEGLLREYLQINPNEHWNAVQMGLLRKEFRSE